MLAYLAGYFLIAPRPYRLSAESLLLPTVSTCINDSFPDTWALNWAHTPAALLEHLVADGLDLPALQAWGEAAFERGEWLWPNVLASLESARALYRQFLHPRPLRLIGLYLPEDQLEIALATLRPLDAHQGECGLYALLRQRLPEPESGTSLGIEIMGLEAGGSLHSFYCNHLQQLYRAAGLTLNAHGLLEPDEARCALELTLDEATRAEPVPWLSFSLREFAL